MLRPENMSIGNWKILHESRKKQIEYKRDQSGSLTPEEESKLLFSSLVVIQARELLEEKED